MSEEDEAAPRTEKVLRIQRVFINLLDTYSSGNIGKVSGGVPKADPSLPLQGTNPGSTGAGLLQGTSQIPGLASVPGPHSAPKGWKPANPALFLALLT